MGKKVLSTVIGIGIAVVAVALAAPTGGLSVAAALGLTKIAAAVVGAVAAMVFTVAANELMKAVGITNGAPSAAQAGPPQVFNQALTDSFILYGRRRTAFLKWVFFHSKKVGKTHYRYFVFAVAGHRCKGDPAWLLNDEPVTVDGSGKVTSGPYANKVWLWFQRGLEAETANATFVSECGGKWTSAHKGNGIAAIYMKAEMSDEVVQAGFCTPSAIIDGKDDIYDPRDETTKYTANGALVYYDWMQLAREEGGFGLYPEEVPDDDYISAIANVCDETVDGEARYQLDALIVTGAAPSEIRDAMVVNMAGSRTYAGGREIMRPGYWVPPSGTLHEDDLAGPITVSPWLTGDASANEVQGSYVSPEDNYQGAPVPTQRIEAADVKQISIDLGMVTSVKRAVRILRIMLGRAQCEKTVVWPMNIAGLKQKALDVVQLATSRYGLSNYAFVVSGWRFSPEWGVTFGLREENEDIYADAAVTIPDAAAAIAKAEPVLLDRDASVLINTSSAIDLALEGHDDNIVISDHFRRYSDSGDVEVVGATLTVDANDDPIAAGETYLIAYDDPQRDGGAVDYVAYPSDAAADAFTSGSNPHRHFVGTVTTAEVGADPVEGQGSLPPGASGPVRSGETIYDGQVPL